MKLELILFQSFLFMIIDLNLHKQKDRENGKDNNIMVKQSYGSFFSEISFGYKLS